MKNKKKLRIMIFLIVLSLANTVMLTPALAVSDYLVSTLSAEYSAGSVSISGTTTEGVLAVAVLLYDKDGATLLRMESYGVENGQFSGIIQISLSSGNYTVKAANYEGGNFTSTTFKVSGSSGNSGGSTSTPTPSPSSTYQAEVKDGETQTKNHIITVDSATNTGLVSLTQDEVEKYLLKNNTVIKIPSIPDIKAYTMELPAKILSTDQGSGSLTLASNTGSITIPNNMLSSLKDIGSKNAGITIKAVDKTSLPDNIRNTIGEKPIISLTLTLDGQKVFWNNPEAPVIVSIPYTPTEEELNNPEQIVVWYIDGSGNTVSIPNGRYDPITRTVTFTTTHFSYYALAYNPINFNDVPKNAYYSKAVSFIAARGITRGTGNNNYNPIAQLSRSEFLVLMMRAYDIAPDENPKNNFSDAGNFHYTGYLAAAKRLGITAGVGNNMFAPDRKITRQEMFTMLYNTLKAIKKLPYSINGNTLSNYTDAGQISVWANEAMKHMVETGVVVGNGGRLNPSSTASRAEMAQIIYTLLMK